MGVTWVMMVGHEGLAGMLGWPKPVAMGGLRLICYNVTSG